ncbi:MAG TPA: ABC transporter substrate-binding protein [Polyangiaceae bacterium]
MAPRAWAGLLGPSLLCGCNALVDTSTNQCDTALDCKSRGGELAGMFCSAEKICTSTPLSCTTTGECTRRLGEPGYCRPDGICTRVLSAECTRVVPKGALSHSDVILAGFMGPLEPPFESQGTPLLQAAELAFEEMSKKRIPGVAAGPERHLAMLVCNDAPEDLNTLQRPFDVASYLVDTVGVPVIIGPSKVYADAIDVITKVTSARGVLTISPSASQADIPEMEQEGLFWRTVPSDAIQADVWRPLSLMVVANFWKNDVLPETEEPHVRYVARADAYGTGLIESFRELVWKHAQVQPQGASYSLQERPDWEALATEIVNARPHALYAFSTLEFVTELLPRIERFWGSAHPKPYYMLLDGTRVDALLAAVDANPELGTRILGSAPGLRTTPRFNGFRDRFRLSFDQEPGNLAEFAYDAAYLVAYAVASAKTQRPTGGELAGALRNMSCPEGTAIEPGPDAFATGLAAVTETSCVNYEGASGPLDFDSLTGEARNDYSLWCPAPDASGKTTFRELGKWYDNVSRHMSGFQEDELLQFCSATE